MPQYEVQPGPCCPLLCWDSDGSQLKHFSVSFGHRSHCKDVVCVFICDFIENLSVNFLLQSSTWHGTSWSFVCVFWWCANWPGKLTSILTIITCPLKVLVGSLVFQQTIETFECFATVFTRKLIIWMFSLHVGPEGNQHDTTFLTIKTNIWILTISTSKKYLCSSLWCSSIAWIYWTRHIRLWLFTTGRPTTTYICW